MADFSQDAEQNPAADASGKTLAELFASDPMSLTREERGEIIRAMRKQRTEFMQEDAQKKTKQTKKKASKSAADDIDIDLDDIKL